ncbi:hypothetical protein FAZ19_04515 [Sphingobacterium alkalisoli]|uniref:Uncharacterized protein n=1 Tax=Sphingobacterium alkalisoli TaxID=1874115 RepID=A0A4U0H9F3_9SPHI|nr:hypothetical protein [Sphingobacterium alkalisoli]TJY68523.1 hypothetical protein FAZ19_04515 [Sphingobacterium alkalisoli]
MLRIISTYRKLSASLLAGWMCIIVISGVVFMHKEVTSSGEIVTHIHPYDFTDKSPKKHHKSDGEIQYLNIVFQGSFISSDFVSFEIPFFQEFQFENYSCYSYHEYASVFYSYYLRGPPQGQV